MSKRGFTILELLLSMGIIALLAAMVIVAINPGRQLAQGRNSARQADTLQVLKAVQQYVAGSGSTYPVGVDSTLRMIGTDTSGCDIDCAGTLLPAACINLGAVLVPEFLASLPRDPMVGSVGKTYYAIQLLTSNRVHVRACSPDLGATVQSEQ